MVSASEDRLIQVQPDRLIFNWKKAGQGPYPRFEAVRQEFVEAAERFGAFLQREELGSPEPEQCEVTYINHLPVGDGTLEVAGTLGQAFSVWKDVKGFAGTPEQPQFSMAYVMTHDDRPCGRLHVTLKLGRLRSFGRQGARMASAAWLPEWEGASARSVGTPPSLFALSESDVVVLEPEPRHGSSEAGLDRPSWLLPVLRRLVALLELDQNWDSFGAPQIDAAAASIAVDVLREAGIPGMPVPSIVPAAHGGVQLEWHAGQMDIEVEIWPEGGVELYVADLSSNEVSEEAINADVRSLWQALRKLTTRIG